MLKIHGYPIKHLVTHSGKFHADEVFATVLCNIIYSEMQIPNLPDNYEHLCPKIQTFRVLNSEAEEYVKMGPEMGYLVYDVGDGEFDHHTDDPAKRWTNGVKKSSFGLLWTELYDHFLYEIGQSGVNRITRSLVQAIDESDTSGKYNPIAEQISMFNGYRFEMEEDNPVTQNNLNFMDACNFAYQVLRNFLFDNWNVVRQLKRLQDSIEDTLVIGEYKVAIVAEHIDTRLLRNIDDCFRASIYVSDRDPGFILRSADIRYHGKPAGIRYRKEVLDGTKKVEGMLWFHPNGFISRFDTVAHAIAFVKEWYDEHPEDFASDTHFTKIMADERRNGQK